MNPTSDDITRLLNAWSQGDDTAREHLVPLVYDALRRIAYGHVRREPHEGTLGGTALAHEAYLRLVKNPGVDWNDRSHFYAVASQIMRRILIDAARARRTSKRGGHLAVVEHEQAFDFDRLPSPDTEPAMALCALDDALKALARVDPRRAQVVELRYFGGLSVEETAQVLGISTPTVTRDWNVARAFLAREMRRSPDVAAKQPG